MTISLSNATVVAPGVDPPVTSVTAGYSLNSDGSISKNVNGTKTNIGNWDSVANQGSSYECEFALTSGTTLSNNTATTWTNLGTNQGFALTHGVGSVSSVVSVKIRDVATHTVQASCSITLNDFLSH